jgi:hypothetical protein
VRGAKDAQGSVGKPLHEAKEPSRKTGIVTAFNLLFLRVRRRREMKLMMKMMMW